MAWLLKLVIKVSHLLKTKTKAKIFAVIFSFRTLNAWVMSKSDYYLIVEGKAK